MGKEVVERTKEEARGNNVRNDENPEYGYSSIFSSEDDNNNNNGYRKMNRKFGNRK